MAVVTLESEPLLGKPKQVQWSPPFSRSSEAYGSILLALSSLGFSSMAFVLHVLSAPQFGFGINPIFLTWFRCLVQFLSGALGIALLVPRDSILPGASVSTIVLITLRGLTGGSAFLCFYEAIPRLPLGDFMTLFFISPFLTVLIGMVFLGEPISLVELGLSVVSFIGIALVGLHKNGGAYNTNTRSHLVGVAFALAAALLSACAYNFIRKVGSKAHFLVQVCSVSAWAFILSSAMLGTSIFNHLRTVLAVRQNVALIVFACVAGLFGQCCLNRGLQLSSGMSVMIRNVDVPLAYILGVMFLGESISMNSAVGSSLVLAATCAVTLRKVRAKK